MNLVDDDGVSFGPTRAKQRWDPKKKNFVNLRNDDDGSGGKGIKMIKGESGVKIPASMKSGRYTSLRHMLTVDSSHGRMLIKQIYHNLEHLRLL